MLKEFVVCEECINGKWGFYSIRTNTDCNSSRFIIFASFDTYEEALEEGIKKALEIILEKGE
jgi:hypothetical protein